MMTNVHSLLSLCYALPCEHVLAEWSKMFPSLLILPGEVRTYRCLYVDFTTLSKGKLLSQQSTMCLGMHICVFEEQVLPDFSSITNTHLVLHTHILTPSCMEDRCQVFSYCPLFSAWVRVFMFERFFGTPSTFVPELVPELTVEKAKKYLHKFPVE